MIEDEGPGRARPCGPSFRMYSAIILIAGGTLLFLSNLGLLPAFDIWDFWPIVIVIVGVKKARSAVQPGGQLTGALIAVFGLIYLLINVGFIHIRAKDESWPISMLLIGVGLLMLINMFDKGGARDWGRFDFKFDLHRKPPQDPENQISDMVILGAVKRKLDSLNFQGGEALSIMGNLEIDLRRARIPEPGNPVILDISAIFGAVKIRVPEVWRVTINGAGILGNYEDKTVPPVLSSNAPTLVITGYSIFSNVEVED